jgi:membrane-bound lytic murein transglycosylase B
MPAKRGIMGDMSIRRRLCGVVAAAAFAGLVGCGGGRSDRPPSHQLGPAQVAVPRQPRPLAQRLSTVDARLRRAIHGWASPALPHGRPTPGVSARAIWVERALRLLARRQGLERETIHRLPFRLQREVRAVTGALRDLDRLSAGWPAHRVRIGAPDPLDRLVRYYRDAQDRFGVRWRILAAINLVESAFGRVRSSSVAGAQGPMQFIPSTWRAYGLGGDIDDPHDAILAAANLLAHGGAPSDYTRALYAYNPSPAYVDAVLRYARLIARDQAALYYLYSWRP